MKVNYELSNNPLKDIDIPSTSKPLSNIPPPITQEENNLSSFDGFGDEALMAIMIRTSLVGSMMSVPKTVFLNGNDNQSTNDKALLKKYPAQRYITISKTAKLIGFEVEDRLGISKAETFQYKPDPTVDDYEKTLKTFDFVCRWPLNINQLPKTELASFSQGFKNDWLDTIQNLKFVPTSNVVIEGLPGFTYEYTRNSIATKSSMKNFIEVYYKGSQGIYNIGAHLGSKHDPIYASFLKEGEGEESNGKIDAYSGFY